MTPSSDAATRVLAEQQRWADAPAAMGRALNSLTPAAIPAGLVPIEVENLAAAAVSLTPDRDTHYQRLVTEGSRLSEPVLLSLGAAWLDSECVFLHLLIADAIAAKDHVSERTALHVLDWGIAYQEPSLNRIFVEAALKHLGRERVLRAILDRTDSLAGAYYWVRDGSSISSGERAVEREVRKRLLPSAPFLRPWWRPW